MICSIRSSSLMTSSRSSRRGSLGLELGADELDRGADAGQRVADLVGDVGRQLAERHQPVDLLLELAVLGLGDRLGQHHRADRPRRPRRACGSDSALSVSSRPSASSRKSRGSRAAPLSQRASAPGNSRAPGMPSSAPGSTPEQLLDAAVGVDHLALAIERDHAPARARRAPATGQRTGAGAGALGLGRPACQRSRCAWCAPPGGRAVAARAHGVAHAR